jgi:hypothetical protein
MGNNLFIPEGSLAISAYNFSILLKKLLAVIFQPLNINTPS